MRSHVQYWKVKYLFVTSSQLSNFETLRLQTTVSLEPSPPPKPELDETEQSLRSMFLRKHLKPERWDQVISLSTLEKYGIAAVRHPRMDVIEKLQRHFYGPSMKEISEESSSSPSIGGSDAEASSGSGEVQLPMPTRASKRRLRAAAPPPPPHDHDNLNPKRHLRRNHPRNCRLPPQKSPTPPPVQATDDSEEEEGQVEFKRKRKASECDHGAAKKAQSSKQQEAQSERSVEDIVQALEELPIFQAPSSPQTKSKPKGAAAPSDKRKLAGCSSSSSSDLIMKALTGILRCVELVERFKANEKEMRKKEAELIEKQKELDEAKLVAVEAIKKIDAELVEKQKQLDEALASSVDMAARNDALVAKLSEAEKIAVDANTTIKNQDTPSRSRMPRFWCWKGWWRV
ncbi:hypothetical protein Dimus_009705 [Dionaea muscipula]